MYKIGVKGCPKTAPLLLFRCKILVYLLDKLVCVGSVNGTRILDGLSSGRGATQTVHPDREEELRGLGITIQNIADDALLGNFHGSFFLSVFLGRGGDFFPIIPTTNIIP